MLHWSTPPLSHKLGVPQVMSMGTHNSRHTHKKFFSEEECSWCMATHRPSTSTHTTHHQGHTHHTEEQDTCLYIYLNHVIEVLIGIKPLKFYVMEKFLMFLLRSMIIILIIGFVFTCCFLSVHEKELAISCVAGTAYAILPMFIIAVIIDIMLERAS